MSEQPAKLSVWRRLWILTGFGPYPDEREASTKDVKRGKTLWDLAQVFIIPLTLFILANFINSESNTREKNAAAALQQDNLLRAYVDKMTDLIVQQKLGLNGQSDQGKSAGQAQTTSVVYTLDGVHRGRLLQFLHESKLILYSDPRLDKEAVQRGNPVIALDGVDLSGTVLTDSTLRSDYLTKVILKSANFTDSDLYGCILNGANLSKATLVNANLQLALLQQVDLSGADLSGANLSGADLSGANLSGANLTGANLTGANLTGANLNGANLTDANLTGVNLTDTIVTEDQLAKAKSREGIVTATPTPTSIPAPTQTPTLASTPTAGAQ